jgi:hypothetical protein
MTSETHRSPSGLLVVANSGPTGDRTHFSSSRDDVIYGGFDGRIWPLGKPDFIDGFSGFADLSQLEEAIQYLASGPSQAMRLLFIRERLSAPVAGATDFRQIGIDVGYFESIYNYFSFSLQDVLSGRIDALAKFRANLNKDGLFVDASTISAFLEERRKLVTSGYDLEFDPSDRIVRVEVWKYASNIRSSALLT